MEPHASRDGVDKLMLHILRAVSLRAEAERWKHTATILKYKADDALRDVENMVYELIDGAMDQFVGRKGRLPMVADGLTTGRKHFSK
jgi:hypothetical protein